MIKESIILEIDFKLNGQKFGFISSELTPVVADAIFEALNPANTFNILGFHKTTTPDIIHKIRSEKKDEND